MAHNIVMPALEMAQESGKLLAWRKQEGQSVNKGEPLFDVETDKAVVEIESPGEGILAGITAREGDVVLVGATIAWLLLPGESLPAPVAAVNSGRHMKSDAASAPVSTPGNTLPGSSPSLKISPKARRLARENNIALEGVRGSGPEGEIVADDILALVKNQASTAVASAGTTASTGPLSAVARLMAERTTQSWTSVPHFFVVREVDSGALLAGRESIAADLKKSNGVRVTITDLLVACTAQVLRKHPQLNSSWSGGVQSNPAINVALAIAVQDGVASVVIPAADAKSVEDIAKLRVSLTERARQGRLQPRDIAGATFTISNLGMYKVDAFSAIISAPQAAILAVGAISDRVVAIAGQPAIRPVMTLTLSCDHRVVDGARAAMFLSDLCDALQAPGTAVK
jgi:pyruvate dehydrogenase E2 component (dihydrolipoamide acetyltransferase)